MPSDAVESVVNLIGGFMALAMLTVAARPADEDHAYGHGKVETIADAGSIMPPKSTWSEPKLRDAMFCRMI